MKLRTLSCAVPALLLLGACSVEEYESAPVETPSTTSAADEAAPDAGTPDIVDAAKSAAESVSSEAADYVGQAETLLAEVQGFLAANNLDKAKLSLGKLEALEDKLPESWAPTIEKVRSAAKALEAKSGLKMPSLDDVKLPGGG